MGLLYDDDESFVLIGKLVNNADLLCGESGVQLEYAGS